MSRRDGRRSLSALVGVLLVVAAVSGLAVGASVSGVVTLDGSNAIDGSEFVYELDDEDEISDLEVEMTGQRVTEEESVSSTTESGTLDVQPRGTGEPEDAIMTLEGVLSEEHMDESYQSFDNDDSESIDLGGSETIPMDVEIEGSTRSISDGISGTAANGDSITISDDPQNIIDGEISIEGDQKSITKESDGSTTYVDLDYKLGADQISYERTMTSDGSTSMEVIAIDDGGSELKTLYSNSGTILNPPTTVSNTESLESPPEGTEEIKVTTSNVESIEYEIWSSKSELVLNSDQQSKTVGPTDGESTESIDLDPGEEFDLEVRGPDPDYELSFTEEFYAVEPTVSFGGESASSEETLSEGETDNVSLDLDPGTRDLSVDTTESVDLNLDWIETTATSNPSMDLAGESVVNSGELAEGETVSQPITLDSGTDYEAEINSDGPVAASVEWIDVSDTVDPSVSINGQTAQHDGVLAEGETASLDVSESWIQSGTNNVEVGLKTAGGPEPQVDMDFSHATTGDSTSSTVDATEWTETREVERSFDSDRDDVTIDIPLDDRVVSVESVDLFIDGAEYNPDYELDGTDIEVVVGEVVEGETVEVVVEARKVSVEDGEIEVIEPTTDGDLLNTLVEVVEAPEDLLRIDVSNTQTVTEDQRLIWTEDESYSEETRSEIRPDGGQTLITNANLDSTFRAVQTDVIDPDVSSGSATITDIDESDDELAFSIDKSDSVSTFGVGYDRLGYLALETDDGRLVDDGDDRVETRNAGSYLIVEGEPSSIIGGISGGDGEGLLGSIPGFVWLIGGVVGGLGALGVVSRRVGSDGSGSDGGSSIGAPAIAIFGIGAATIALISLELVTPYSIVDTAISGVFGTIERIFASVFETLTTGPFAALVGSLALLLAIVAIDQRTDIEIPLPYYVGSATLAAVLVIEILSPGVLIESLAGGLEEVGALVWLLLIGGPIVLVALWLRSRRPEIVIGSEGGR